MFLLLKELAMVDKLRKLRLAWYEYGEGWLFTKSMIDRNSFNQSKKLSDLSKKKKSILMIDDYENFH